MKNVLMMCAIAASIVLSGCATTPSSSPVLDTVGPAPLASPVTGSGNGTLMVYSGYKRNADFNSSDPNREEHSDYKILNADGTLLRKVHNVTKTVFEDAVPVSLPPGKYQVVARANAYGYLTIPVRIEPKQTTVLHLEGGGFWSDESLFNATNSVRLPDSEIIGWKSTSD
jgi:hypothetical protein